MNSPNPDEQNERHELGELQTRLQETEIKLAFLEKELGEYKEALHTLHTRLDATERTLQQLQESGSNQSGGGEDPFAS